MRKRWILLYILLQCTWGIVQTSIGLILFFRYIRCSHRLFYGAVHTGWERNDGISLGLFIFSPGCEDENKNSSDRKLYNKRTEGFSRLTVHEYGHTFQSLMLGPLYLVVIGLPSVIWANSKRYIELRRQYGVPYSFCFAEGWADRLGERMTLT